MYGGVWYGVLVMPQQLTMFFATWQTQLYASDAWKYHAGLPGGSLRIDRSLLPWRVGKNYLIIYRSEKQGLGVLTGQKIFLVPNLIEDDGRWWTVKRSHLGCLNPGNPDQSRENEKDSETEASRLQCFLFWKNWASLGSQYCKGCQVFNKLMSYNRYSMLKCCMFI